MTATPRRLCPSHQVQLVERAGRPYCPWRTGHFPDQWLEDDPGNPGQQRTVSDAAGESQTVDAWRAGLRDHVPARQHPRPGPTPAAAPAPAGPATAPPRPLERADTKPAAPPVPAGKTKPKTIAAAAVAQPAEEGDDMPVPKCSKCGGNGHNRRTCSKGRAGTPAAGSAQATRAARARPAPAAAATSTALALGKAADLHELRDQLASNLAELDQAIVVFDLIEKTIPEQHVEAARALLVEAGLAKESVTGRHSIVLGKIVASVAATLFAADGPRISQKKVDALVAAADAIGAAQ